MFLRSLYGKKKFVVEYAGKLDEATVWSQAERVLKTSF